MKKYAIVGLLVGVTAAAVYTSPAPKPKQKKTFTQVSRDLGLTCRLGNISHIFYKDRSEQEIDIISMEKSDWTNVILVVDLTSCLDHSVHSNPSATYIKINLNDKTFFLYGDPQLVYAFKKELTE